jgi:predicted GIY-YIG superfamily endonuclease
VCIYVGQSRNITQRIYQHIQDGVKRFDGMSHIAVKVANLLEVERYFIEKLIPRYTNAALPTP